MEGVAVGGGERGFEGTAAGTDVGEQGHDRGHPGWGGRSDLPLGGIVGSGFGDGLGVDEFKGSDEVTDRGGLQHVLVGRWDGQEAAPSGGGSG